MFKDIKNLLFSRGKYEFDVRDNDILRMSAAINCLEQRICYAKIRSDRDKQHIADLKEQLRNLSNELQEAKCLTESKKKNNISSVSVNTDLIIDMQNELRNTENKIKHLRELLRMHERQTYELSTQYSSTIMTIRHSERRRAHMQISCGRAEIAAMQYRMQANRSSRLPD